LRMGMETFFQGSIYPGLPTVPHGVRLPVARGINSTRLSPASDLLKAP